MPADIALMHDTISHGITAFADAVAARKQAADAAVHQRAEAVRESLAGPIEAAEAHVTLFRAAVEAARPLLAQLAFVAAGAKAPGLSSADSWAFTRARDEAVEFADAALPAAEAAVAEARALPERARSSKLSERDVRGEANALRQRMLYLAEYVPAFDRLIGRLRAFLARVADASPRPEPIAVEPEPTAAPSKIPAKRGRA